MRVGLFHTCLIDLVRPDIGLSVLTLLENAGCTVEVPQAQTCCGQPAYNSGDAATARALAQQMLDAFAGYDYVVVPSGSCGAMIKVDYPELLRDDPDLKARIDALSARTYELTDFMVRVLKIERVASPFVGRITHHDSCSGLRYLGVREQPRQLLQAIPGVALTEMKDGRNCCGFGGTFSVKYGDISSAIVDEKCRNIQASGADAVVL